MSHTSSASAPPGALGSSAIRWLAASVIVLWAAAFVGVGYALRELEPGPLALARFLVAALVLWAWSGLARRSDLRHARGVPTQASGTDRMRMALCGLLGIATYNLALNMGQRTVGAGVASLLVNTVPIWTALLSALWLGAALPGPDWPSLAWR